jgi:Ca-activated chloride channel family protein
MPQYRPPFCARDLSIDRVAFNLLVLVMGALSFAASANAQGFERELATAETVDLRVTNRMGRVTIMASSEHQSKVSVRAESHGKPIGERDVIIEAGGGSVSIEVGRESLERPNGMKPYSGSVARAARERIDITVRVPLRSRVIVETSAGAVDIVGNVSEAEVKTETGTIRADVPLDALRYNFKWTLARPRFYSEVPLAKIKEKRGGLYEISGHFGEKKPNQNERVQLKLETARGVILFGIADEASVPADLRERELTEAARAVIRSGDQDLTNAIRRVAPKLVGDYTETLPHRGAEPILTQRANPFNVKTQIGEQLARLQASVTDRNGRAIGGLSKSDFSVFEDGQMRSIRDVRSSSAPFNLVLLLDVSGSIEERIDFIRKAALNFISTVGQRDRVAIVSFRDDIQLISDFTTNRTQLAERIKDIQAGGGTALYDALAYSLVDTLRPLRGDRTAIVVLSDGDDNKSFIPFNSILEAVIETGALVYTLYVPSGLIPASSTPVPTSTLDPMRTRYLTLTSRADAEGRKLAEVSGGVYYPIARIDQLQRAYDDVVNQLRTAYTITYETSAAVRQDARVRVRVARQGASVRLSPAIGVSATAVRP